MFYFQHLLNTALAGIDGTVIVPTVTSLAFAILLIGFLIGLYQAAFRGGDLQALAVTAVKYLVVAMIVANWASVFRSVNGSFNSMANSIGSSSGAGDMFQSWMGQLQQQFANNPSLTLTDLITGDAASTITVVLLVVAYLLYALAMIFFCFFYTLFGAVLYVIGPLVLALIPISGVGQLGKAYAINVMVWNASTRCLERSLLRSRATKSTTYWVMGSLVFSREQGIRSCSGWSVSSTPWRSP